MRKLMMTVAAVLAVPALAQTNAEQAQRLKELNAEIQPQLAEGNRKSCEAAKAKVAQHADQCADEQAKLGSLDCQDAAARKASDFLKVSTTCLRRVSDQAKAAATEPVPCKAVDAAGAVIGEGLSPGNYLKCSVALKDALEKRCGAEKPGAFLKYTLTSSFLGKEHVSKQTYFCPRAKKER